MGLSLTRRLDSEILNGILVHLLLLLICGEVVKGALMEVKATPEKCQEADLQECSATAESLIKDPGLIFPDKPSTLDRVCSMWNRLTSCIDNYTTKCYTRPEKTKFDRLFKESIMAMTTVCTDESYKNDYLKYAPCVRRITTDGEHCGFPYQILIDQISNPEVTLKQLCCARTKFKSCILAKTKSVCDNGQAVNGPPGEKVPIGSMKPMNITMFAQQVVDKSLAFIAQQCATIKAGRNDCEIGNSVLLRPNSKGPLINSEEIFYYNTSSSKPPPREPLLTAGLSTKFQTGQKVSGNSWNTIAPLEKQSEFNLPSPGGGGAKQKQNFPETRKPGGNQYQTVTGLIPKGNEYNKAGSDKEPENDRLKLGQTGFGPGTENTGTQIHTITILPIFITLAFTQFILP